MKRGSRGIQNSTLELPTRRGTRDLAASSFSFQWIVHGRADQKNTPFPAIFGTFPILMYFWRGNRGASKNPKRDFPNSCGTRDMAAGSFNFIGKHEAGPNKNRHFLKFRFSDPWKPKIAHKGAPPLLVIWSGPLFLRGLLAALGRYLLVLYKHGLYC